MKMIVFEVTVDDTCSRCESEIVLVSSPGAETSLECPCGSVAVLT
ncbi:hypothetical protein BH24ACT26_BH24ACT26_03880 [soil metagenome]